MVRFADDAAAAAAEHFDLYNREDNVVSIVDEDRTFALVEPLVGVAFDRLRPATSRLTRTLVAAHRLSVADLLMCLWRQKVVVVVAGVFAGRLCDWTAAAAAS